MCNYKFDDFLNKEINFFFFFSIELKNMTDSIEIKAKIRKLTQIVSEAALHPK